MLDRKRDKVVNESSSFSAATASRERGMERKSPGRWPQGTRRKGPRRKRLGCECGARTEASGLRVWCPNKGDRAVASSSRRCRRAAPRAVGLTDRGCSRAARGGAPSRRVRRRVRARDSGGGGGGGEGVSPAPPGAFEARRAGGADGARMRRGNGSENDGIARLRQRKKRREKGRMRRQKEGGKGDASTGAVPGSENAVALRSVRRRARELVLCGRTRAVNGRNTQRRVVGARRRVFCWVREGGGGRWRTRRQGVCRVRVRVCGA